MFHRMSAILLGLVVAVLISGCSAGSVGTAGTQISSAAAEYCAQNGGVVETRYPFYGTNDPNPLQLSGSMQVCAFTSGTDQSRILVALDTLYADEPTLAAIAYRARQPLAPSDSGGNPSSRYCTQLGGTDAFGGLNASGGGWAKEGATDVISMCIFPDLSSMGIDLP
jgi:putative hemolysin